MTQENEVGFVTRKVLVTFNHPIAFPMQEGVVFSQAAICEWQDQNAEVRGDVTSCKQFRVVALPNMKELVKSLYLSIGWQSMTAVVDLD